MSDSPDADVVGMAGHVGAHRQIAERLGLPWPPGPRPEPRRWKYPLASLESPPRCFMDDVRITWGRRPWRDSVDLLHEPTGRHSEGLRLHNAIADLALQLVQHGDITINDARRAMGMPEWKEDTAWTPSA